MKRFFQSKSCRLFQPLFERAPSSFFPALVLGAWLALPGQARAGGVEASTALVSTALFSGAVGTGGLVALIGNSANLARRPPNRSWPISGYVLGSLNIVVGSLWFALFRVETPLYAVGGSLIGLGLTDLGLLSGSDLSRPLGQLSVGQRRRVALGCIVANRPHVLVMDEPTNHLSLTLAEELEEALMTTLGAVIVASHDRWLRRRWNGDELRLERAGAGEEN